ASGSWFNPSTWDCGIVPTSADDVEIMPGHTVVMDPQPPDLVSAEAGKDAGTAAIQRPLQSDPRGKAPDPPPNPKSRDLTVQPQAKVKDDRSKAEAHNKPLDVY